MFSIHSPLPCSVKVKGKLLKLNLSFDVVLDCYSVMRRDDLLNIHQNDLCLRLLIKRGYRFVKRLTSEEQNELLNLIFKQYINMDDRKGGSAQKTFDFEYDANLIFSGFWQTYGIDLFRQFGKLDWREFISLFQSLPDNTKIREVMSIRARELPKPTKYNQEEIKHLMELKRYWALPVDGNEGTYQNQLGIIFNTLYRMCEGASESKR